MDNKTPTQPMIKARHIPDASIVRLKDGRLGYLARDGARLIVVIVAEEIGVEIRPDTLLEVVLYPRQVAGIWLTRQSADCGG